VDLPTPASISLFWNVGSLLGMCLVIQVLTGLLVSIHYTSNIDLAFNSVVHIIRDVNIGWILRLIHFNGASLFFIIVYIHVGRGIFFSSFLTKPMVWNTGIVIVLLLIGTAFLGYVLPWGQMSFWGATVITNLLSAIPYLGKIIVEWLWGGFSINNATLTRFYSLHFLLPFVLIALVLFHLMFLHISGSSNPLGTNSNLDKISFHPFFSSKDILGFLVVLIMFFMLVLKFPLLLGDPENFNMANPLNTPIHIQPEWYFLFAYAILRSIPNKLGGVIALLASILILGTLALSKTNFLSMKFYIFKKVIFWVLVNNFLILTWIGANPVEVPFEMIGQFIRLLYFLNYIMFF